MEGEETDILGDLNEKYNSILKNIPPITSTFGRTSFSQELACLLFGMGMEKYIDIFKNNDISLEVFMSLTIEDLKCIGIEDENDCSKIVSIACLDNNRTLCITPVSRIDPADDLTIANNLLLHCNTINSNLTMLLKKLDNFLIANYHITKEFSAQDLLSLVCKKGIQQSDLSINLINGTDNNSLIETFLLAANLELPYPLKSKLMGTRKIRKKRVAMVFLVATGVCSLAVLAQSYLRS